MLLVSPIRWWVLWLESALFIIYGLVAFLLGQARPLLNQVIFAGLTIAFSILAFYLAKKERSRFVTWWLNLLIAACNALLGLATLFIPLFFLPNNPEFLPTLMGIQGLFHGVISISISISLRQESRFKGFFVLYALCTIFISIALLANPFLNSFVTFVIMGIYGIVSGLSLLPGAMKIRQTR